MLVTTGNSKYLTGIIFLPKLSYSKNGTSFKDRNTKKKGNKAKL